MKKEWKVPEVQSLNVSETEHSPSLGSKVDGSFIDGNGDLWSSYAPS